MKLQKLKGSIRGDLPSLPFLTFLILIVYLAGFTSIGKVVLSGSAKAQMAKKVNEIISAFYQDKANVAMPEGSYLFIDSCTDFLVNYKNYLDNGIVIGDKKLEKEKIEEIGENCKKVLGVICLGRDIKGYFSIYCGYTSIEPENKIVEKIEKDKVLVVKKSDSKAKISIKG